MGLTFSSSADSGVPLPDFDAPLSPAAQAAIEQARPKDGFSYLDLPAPLRYEELQREVLAALKPDHFEGLKLEMTRPLSQNAALTHSIFMGNMEIPTNNKQVIKCPVGTYDFGATFGSEKFAVFGRVSSDARLSARAKYDLNSWLSFKLQAQAGSEPGSVQALVDADLKGSDWNAQLKFGNPGFYGANYFQSVTPHLSLGGEMFWLAGAMKSGVGLAARHTGDAHITTAQVATTGIVSLQYAHKVGEKVLLATDLLWNYNSREVTATVGYDCHLRQCRLRGRIDTNGVVSQYLEERFAPGFNIVFSGEIDHANKNYRFGFGLVAGE